MPLIPYKGTSEPFFQPLATQPVGGWENGSRTPYVRKRRIITSRVAPAGRQRLAAATAQDWILAEPFPFVTRKRNRLASPAEIFSVAVPPVSVDFGWQTFNLPPVLLRRNRQATDSETLFVAPPAVPPWFVSEPYPQVRKRNVQPAQPEVIPVLSVLFSGWSDISAVFRPVTRIRRTQDDLQFPLAAIPQGWVDEPRLIRQVPRRAYFHFDLFYPIPAAPVPGQFAWQTENLPIRRPRNVQLAQAELPYPITPAVPAVSFGWSFDSATLRRSKQTRPSQVDLLFPIVAPIVQAPSGWRDDFTVVKARKISRAEQIDTPFSPFPQVSFGWHTENATILAKRISRRGVIDELQPTTAFVLATEGWNIEQVRIRQREESIQKSRSNLPPELILSPPTIPGAWGWETEPIRKQHRVRLWRFVYDDPVFGDVLQPEPGAGQPPWIILNLMVPGPIIIDLNNDPPRGLVFDVLVPGPIVIEE